VPSPADAVTRADSLDALRQVIRRIEGARPPRPAPAPIEAVVGGEVVETSQGRLVVVRREFPLDHCHGGWRLGRSVAVAPAVLGLIAKGGQESPDPRRLLFLDTETTGLAGGTGTYAFLVGAGWVEGERFVVSQYFMRDFDEEPALLEALAPRLEQASGLVTFNGAGFDLPLLETRHVLARRRWPGAIPHVDLLPPARRVWSFRLEDCRLSTLEREVLGLSRAEDVPAPMIPLIYFDFVRHRRAAPLARVFAHNRDDVLSLAALLGWFGRALGRAGQTELDAVDLAGMGRLCERFDLARAADYYRRALDAGLDGPIGQRVQLRLAAWEKRQARWDDACALWRAATELPAFDAGPWEELAKYHEHRSRDIAAARAIVLTALDHARRAAAWRAVAALNHRLARLDRRLCRLSPGVC
jgi:uncharacterized protein YprB with RNaseH-like and TPR domain